MFVAITPPPPSLSLSSFSSHYVGIGLLYVIIPKCANYFSNVYNSQPHTFTTWAGRGLFLFHFPPDIFPISIHL